MKVKVELPALPAMVRSTVTIRYQEPGSMPPRFFSIAPDVSFPSDRLPDADVRAMLRQKTLVPATSGGVTPMADDLAPQEPAKATPATQDGADDGVD